MCLTKQISPTFAVKLQCILIPSINTKGARTIRNSSPHIDTSWFQSLGIGSDTFIDVFWWIAVNTTVVVVDHSLHTEKTSRQTLPPSVKPFCMEASESSCHRWILCAVTTFPNNLSGIFISFCHIVTPHWIDVLYNKGPWSYPSPVS